MNRIHILSENVRNKIAAGEVIERPVSVVKELVENSLDAGATQLTVTVENGGKTLIQVVDNGSGMNEDDALLAFERHATSKIRTSEDILHISSLGFRGEALPSIASVSRLCLLTREQDADVAVKLEFADGKLLEVNRTSANFGTSVTVRNLFYNVPARRKFLRSETAELKHILRYLHYQSLLYPEVTLRLIINGKEKLHYRKTDSLQERISEVFGSSFFELDLIPLDAKHGALSISGYIFGLEEGQNKLFDDKYLFINGRYIYDKMISHSIRTAYAPFISKSRIWQQGSTPPYILFLDVPAELVDFNVHPAKLEVRFRDHQLIHGFIKRSLAEALTGYEEAKFESAKRKFHFASDLQQATFAEKEIFKSRIQIPKYSEYKKEFSNLYQQDVFYQDKELQQTQIPIQNPDKQNEEEQKELFPEMLNESFQLLLKNEEDYVNPWQLHQSYVFLQVEDGLVVIDQHAAHERIMYEKLLRRIEGAPAVRQKLLFPLVIDIPPYIQPVLQNKIEENLALFEKIGFTIKKFSGNSIVVDEIPSELDDWQSGKIFVDILIQLQDEIEVNTDFRDCLAKSIACKASIKAGTLLSKRAMLNLINELYACRVPYFCPHGRPVMFKMTLNEFEKRFKRQI